MAPGILWNMGQKACESQRLEDAEVKRYLMVVTEPCIHPLTAATAASTDLQTPKLVSSPALHREKRVQDAPHLAEQSLTASDCQEKESYFPK